MLSFSFVFLVFFWLMPKIDRTESNLSDYHAHSAQILQNGILPIHFEPNKGQVDGSVHYMSRGKGYTLFITPNEAILSLPPTGNSNEQAAASSIVKMRFEGSNPNPKNTGQKILSGKSNYFMGNDPNKWLTNIPNYGKVKYQDVYEGIDLVYYGNESHLEFDFIVSPNADPKDIILGFESSTLPELDGLGNLIFNDTDQKLFMKPPIAYQIRGDNRAHVEVKYAHLGNNRYGFEIGDYDQEIPMVIDPVVIFSTYLGNNGDAGAQAIAVDSAGNAYISGTTYSHKFPTTHNNLVPNFTGYGHVFITKMNAEGDSLIYSTYFGGHGDDYPRGIALDTAGNILVAGYTLSDDFPMVNAIQSKFKGEGILAGDGFALKLDPEGDALVYSTYMGGDWNDETNDIAVDRAGNAFLTGYTTDPRNFPFKNSLPSFTCDDSYNKGFVMKLDPSGALEFSTCLGGEKNSAIGHGIATDQEGNVYITGSAHMGFPTTAGAYQSQGTGAFVMKINNTGSNVIYSTFLAGNWEVGVERGEAIAVDEAGNAYIVGKTPAENLPVVNAFQPSHANPGTFNDDGFICKLSADGSSLLFSSYIGGDQHDYNLDVDLDKKGNIYICGVTQSSNFPTAEAFQNSLNGHNDIFISMIDGENYDLAFSTYFGGSSWEGGIGQMTGLAVSPGGYVHVAGGTISTDFPTKNAYQETSTTRDAFLLKLLIIEKGILEVSPDPVVFPLTEIGQTSKESIELSNSGLGALEIKKLEVKPVSSYTIENKPDLPYNLDPGDKVEFKIAYSPTSSTSGRTNSSGPGTITIESDAEELITKVSLIPGIVVNLMSDAPDADLEDGVCDTDLSKKDAQVTLRAAIQHINATKNHQVTLVVFDIPVDSVPIIKPNSALPDIDYPIKLDASTQSRGYVVLDGTDAGHGTRGLTINGGESTVKAMNIMNFGSDGISLLKNGNNTIDDCVIIKNGYLMGGPGILIYKTKDNRILNSVVSGNNIDGIVIDSEEEGFNRIENNKIGTRVSGLQALPNGRNGILIFDNSSHNLIQNNLISGNYGHGISIMPFPRQKDSPNENIVIENLIGVSIDKNIELSNGKCGVSITGKGNNSNVISKNVISGNIEDGILVDYGAQDNRIVDNIIGLEKFGNGKNGISFISSKSNEVTGNTIVNNREHGINIVNDNLIIMKINNNQIGVIKNDIDEIQKGNYKSGIFLKQGLLHAFFNRIEDHQIAGIQVIDGAVALRENRFYQNNIGFKVNRTLIHYPGRAQLVQKNIFKMNNSGISIEGEVVQEWDQDNWHLIVANYIHNNTGSNTGIHLKNSNAIIRGNLLSSNLGNAFTVEGESDVTINFNNIVGNQEFGIENLTQSNTISAMHNYWNDGTGPGGQGAGLGDKVSEGVDYSDWMTEFISVFVAAENDTILVPIGRTDSVTLVFEHWTQFDDNLNVTISDEFGWLQSTSPFQVHVPYYPYEDSQLDLNIPASVTDSTFNKVLISASSQADPEDFFNTSFTILAVEPAAISLQISPDTMEVEVGDTIQFEVIGYDHFYNPITAVEWNCTGGIIDESGLFIAANNNGDFTVTVKAPSSGLIAEAQVQISGAVPTGNEPSRDLNKDQLLYNYPNPFTNSTVINYKLYAEADLVLKIYDITGKELIVLAEGKYSAGEHEVTWNPEGLPDGVYISRLKIKGESSILGSSFTVTKKLLLRK